MGRGFMAIMSAMAEDERLRIIKRTHEGRQIARANGVKMGRKPKLNPYQINETCGCPLTLFGGWTIGRLGLTP
jgi:DNA invertase Pin-like site-specific DNA recombinase